MNNYALVVGNSQYANLSDLECCKEDVSAMSNLLHSTKKYTIVKDLVNLESSILKNSLRSFFEILQDVDEVFFYFSGHGYQSDDDFYYCGTNFDSSSPNETGLALTDLHQLLRATNANLVVNVIDACGSGTRLIKSDEWSYPVSKGAFNNHIQMASCLNDQNSVTGDPLSVFTESFIEAVVSRESDIVYYSDIIGSLRDMYLNNDYQTPHFVTQVTGREVFVNSGEVFDDFRKGRTPAVIEPEMHAAENEESDSNELSTLDKLKQLQEKFVDKADAQDFIKEFSGQIIETINILAKSFEGMYEMTNELFGYFQFKESEKFITSILTKQDRADNFVTAKVKKLLNDPQGNSIIDSLTVTFGQLAGREVSYRYELDINCDLEDVQLEVTLTPSVKTLKQIKLCITFAPSLETCFVFEHILSYGMSDWDTYWDSGVDRCRKWYKVSWLDKDHVPNVVANVSDDLQNVVNEDIELALLRANEK